MIGATFIKEMQLFIADKAGMAATFLMPAVFIIGFGMMFQNMGGGSDDDGKGPAALPKLTLAIHYADDHEEAAELANWITSSETFRLERIDTPDALRLHVANKKYRAGLIIPVEYHPRDHPAELCIDLATPQLERLAVEGPLRGAFASYQGMKASPVKIDPAKLPPAPPFWESKSPPGIKKAIDNLDAFQVSVPGNAVLFCFFLALTVAMSFHEERKKGTWRRLLAAPGRRWMMLIAKLLPYALVGVLQMTLLFSLGHFAFGMRVGGSVLALAGTTVAVVFAACSLGLLIASFGGTEKQIGGYSTICILGMGLLGGCMFPRMFMPDSVKTVGNFVPHGHALDAYYDILVRDGTTLADVGQPILIIFAFGAAFVTIASFVFRFEK